MRVDCFVNLVVDFFALMRQLLLKIAKQNFGTSYYKQIIVVICWTVENSGIACWA